MDVDSFERARRLDAGEARALLAGGRPEQRVWAAWAIALRAGSAMPDVVGHVAGEPSAGVRRALLPVLAGHGEVDVLVAMARHDPSVEVRAPAMALVTRLASQGAIATAVVTDAYAGAPAEVRCAILSAIDGAAPDPLRALAAAAVGRGTRDEQLEAFEAALRDGRDERRAAAMRWLARQRDRAIATEGWMRMQRLPAAEIVALIPARDLRMRARALRLLTAIPIGELAALAVDGDSTSFAIIRERRDFASAPPGVLARGVLARCAEGYVDRLTAALAAAPSAPAEVAPLLPRLLEHVRARLAAIAAEHDLPDEQGWPRLPWSRRYQQLLAELERVVA